MALRLGSIEFINTLPVTLGIERGAVDSDIQLIHGAPASLNTMLMAGALDASAVSSIAFARNSRELLLLPDLSINSESGVKSVLLLSSQPIEKLHAFPIRITAKGATTPVLLKILCRKLYDFDPMLVPMAAHEPVGDQLQESIDEGGLLLIGDEALECALKFRAPFVYDLGELWKRATGTPMVFAVWAVRRDVAAERAHEVFRMTEVLRASRVWAAAHPDELIAASQKKVNLSAEELTAYFNRLRFDLDAETRRGLELYYRQASEIGELTGPVTVEEFSLGGVPSWS